MLMSKSRLEKFLYALYSLDSSDLPDPLSRIEELYKCLVTGAEVPTFEPLSRVEKYLMAILGVYDVDSLPNPLSRVEVLLYKLATGDDNLDDVKSFLSEHEELLAEIIRNGGAGGNIDIEYVLYTLSTESNTLYNTAEKPVKSAILKGNTKYRDIDTGDILDTFDETKNLELVSTKMPVLTTTNGEPEFIEVDGEQVPNEAFKSNILTVNEEVELRRIGDVRDELNLLTCELVRRIEEAVLSGSSDEGWSYNTDRGTVVSILAGNIIGTKNGASVLCDKFVTLNDNSIRDKELIRLSETSGKLIVHILKERIGGGPNETRDKYLSLFKTWLSNNPITVQYRLGTESIKTVDLSVVDQDGNDTKLSTFNDITHVTLSSEGLIPEAELEVAEKVTEVEASMLTISREQEVIDTATNEQSENVDATMIATTEIYEGLL